MQLMQKPRALDSRSIRPCAYERNASASLLQHSKRNAGGMRKRKTTRLGGEHHGINGVVSTGYPRGRHTISSRHQDQMQRRSISSLPLHKTKKGGPKQTATSNGNLLQSQTGGSHQKGRGGRKEKAGQVMRYHIKAKAQKANAS